jgi:predicted DCC family thiol-disulfide oxidoreductase YuxK
MTESQRSEIEGRALVLYDGVCALCNGLVRRLLKQDRLARFRYTPLQSLLGQEILGRFGHHAAPDGVALVTDALTPGERLYQRSDAVAMALQLLPSPWPLPGRVLALLPRFLRELGYGLVARVRYRLFGRYATCPIPPPELKSRILDVYR